MQILDHLTLIDNKKESELETYLKKVTNDKDGTHSVSNYCPPKTQRLFNYFVNPSLIVLHNDHSHLLSSQNQKKPRSNEVLDEIFKKIVSTENSKEVTFQSCCGASLEQFVTMTLSLPFVHQQNWFLLRA